MNVVRGASLFNTIGNRIIAFKYHGMKCLDGEHWVEFVSCLGENGVGVNDATSNADGVASSEAHLDILIEQFWI